MNDNRVILTYFEPFGVRDHNASKTAALFLADRYPVHELPVRWNKIEAEIISLLDEAPEYLILFGEAGSYPEVTVECAAHNVARGKDNDGVIKDGILVDGGAEELRTGIDVEVLPLRKSVDAGKFLCNASYYYALSHAGKTKVLFVHVPYLEDPGVRNNAQKSILALAEALGLRRRAI